MRAFVLLFSCLLTLAAAGVNNEIKVGFGTGSNVIPFSQLAGNKPYQQIYGAPKFLQYGSNRIEIHQLSFESNQTITPGATSVNIVLRLATATGITHDQAANLGTDQRVVFAGWVSTDKDGLLTFNLRGRPFVYDPQNGDLVVHIDVVEVFGAGGFKFGPSTGELWRIYYPIGWNTTQVEQAGINTIFNLKTK